MNITNTSKNTLQWPDGTDLPTGKAVKVEAYDEHKDNVIVAAWIKAGILTVGKPKRASKPLSDA